MFVHGLHLRLAEADWTHLLWLQTLAMRHQLTWGEARACNTESCESTNIKLLLENNFKLRDFELFLNLGILTFS